MCKSLIYDVYIHQTYENIETCSCISTKTPEEWGKHSMYTENNSTLVIPSGFPLSTLSVLFVTYCGVQLIKERERRQALLDDPEPVPPTEADKQKAE